MTTQNPEKSDILVIEDNKPLRKYICSALWREGYVTAEAATRSYAFELLRERFFDLVLLDLKLADGSGMEILETIRRQSEDMPVMIVSSTTAVDTKVHGFDVGCDDYVTKPFEAAELLGRIRRLLRKSMRRDAAQQESPQTIQREISVGPFRVDLRSAQAYKHDVPLSLRKKVFELFVFLARNPDRILSKEMLQEQVWSGSPEATTNSIYVHIHELRSAIEEDPSRPAFVKTVRGLGFIFHASS